MRWLIGIDLDERGGGAVNLGLALHAAEPTGTLSPTHVLAEGVDAWFDPPPSTAELRERATKRIRGMLLGDDLAALAENVRVEDPADPVERLAELAADVDGILVGRQVPRGKDAIVRLGTVARRLVRRLPSAIVVCPPDLGAEDVGKGPVLLATDARDDSLGAARFAKAAAKELGRELIVHHVVAMPPSWTMANVSGDRLAEIRAGLIAGGEAELKPWLEKAGLTDAPTRITDGWVVDEIVGHSKDVDPPMVVVGSRRLSAVARLFATSTSSELAARSSCPVAVVPEDWNSNEEES